MTRDKILDLIASAVVTGRFEGWSGDDYHRIPKAIAKDVLAALEEAGVVGEGEQYGPDAAGSGPVRLDSGSTPRPLPAECPICGTTPCALRSLRIVDGEGE